VDMSSILEPELNRRTVGTFVGTLGKKWQEMAAFRGPDLTTKKWLKYCLDKTLQYVVVNGRKSRETAWGARGRQFKSARPDHF
jgi:hypothetical protein